MRVSHQDRGPQCRSVYSREPQQNSGAPGYELKQNLRVTGYESLSEINGQQVMEVEHLKRDLAMYHAAAKMRKQVQVRARTFPNQNVFCSPFKIFVLQI